MSFDDKCDEYFQTRDFYEILNVERDATAAQVKKAYHKVSLLVHPDRVPEHQKLVATEKFKIVSHIYAVLSDAGQRSIYDETGGFNGDFSDTLTEWINVYNSLFREVTTDMIEKHKEQYIDSESELQDLKRAYVSTKGNMTKMFDRVPYLDVANEERVVAIIRKLVDAGDVEEYDGFFNESKAKKARRKRREESQTLTPEEAERGLRELEESRAQSSMRFAVHMAELEARYCKPKQKKAVKRAPASTKKIAKGRVAKRSGRK